ncbi:MAG: transketolase [Firmicutes bacterium]|jgi:transketolase|nr:transketolase [Bacillota bacterium]
MSSQFMKLKETATQVRKDIVTMIHAASSGHPGGSLSAADILTYLFFEKMNINPENPKMDGRDKFVLSKGHAAPVLYSSLARRGFFDPELLLTLRKTGSLLQGHPDMKSIPGVEMSTGSLGQGISTAVGMALANKIDNSDAKTYVLLGDGEMNEGIVWEALMAANHYKLNNLTAILDFNGLQIDGKNEDVMSISPIDKKFESFGWNVIVCDGHDFESIAEAFAKCDEEKEGPSVIIAKTVKGKGVSFMEDQAGWHGKAPSDEELSIALKELGGAL